MDGPKIYNSSVVGRVVELEQAVKALQTQVARLREWIETLHDALSDRVDQIESYLGCVQTSFEGLGVDPTKVESCEPARDVSGW